MFVPLWDMNPLKRVRFPYVTVGIILVNCAVFFFFEAGLLFPVGDDVLVSFAIIPNQLIQHGILNHPAANVAAHQVGIPEGLTLLTYMFLHGNFLHLAGNMIFLWVFGDNVEDDTGHVRFLAFYLICGIFAGLTHALVSENSAVPMIGASGAVAGVIAAYLMLHPNVRVWVPGALPAAAAAERRFCNSGLDRAPSHQRFRRHRSQYRLVGAYRRADRGRRSYPVHAQPRRAAV